MPEPTAKQQKLLDLLRELFQLDQPDLDFGLYRIMHAKAREIEQFLSEDLLATIQRRLGGSKAEKIAEAKATYERERQNAIDYGGNPDTAPKAMQALAEYKAAQETAADDDELFDHLYRFFERYYDGGDFLSRRYYGRGESGAPYAVPYDGSEVYLHWANKDQYYIKSSENFRQFSVDLAQAKAGDAELFTDATPRKLHFALVDAQEGEHGNVKAAADKERYFIVDEAQPLAWNNGELTVSFQYRADGDKTGQAGKWRDERNKRNEQAILAALKQQAQGGEQAAQAAAFAAALGKEIPKGKDGTQTLLAKYLNQYTAKNSMDYFIHKDLGGFLKRELDYYIKNEVLRLDDLGSADAPNAQRLEHTLKKTLILRDIAHKLIAFLAQTEDFQKKLWLKKKFVVDSHWLVTLDKVPAGLYPAIKANDAQWAEWVKLGFVAEGADRAALLTPESKLVLDTSLFDETFTAQFIASIPELDAATDGVLVHCENFQALNLMQARYREQVKCIYIDPPYNTGSDDNFSYKDSFKSSSWLAMFEDRLRQAKSLLNNQGLLASHMDEHEHLSLEWLIKKVFGEDGDLGKLVWDKRNPKGDVKGVAAQHEYVHFATNNPTHLKDAHNAFVRNKENAERILEKARLLIKKSGGISAKVRREFKEWVDAKNDFSGGEKAYSLIDDNGDVYQSVSMTAPDRPETRSHRPLIHPKTQKPCPVPAKGWRFTDKTMDELVHKGQVVFGSDETTIPRRKYLLKENLTESVASLYYMGGSDDALFENMGFFFENPKPVKAASYFLSISARPDDSLVLDYFAGSGTTGHAVINLNREDGGKRKYLLVEMGDYFDVVTKPRIVKVVYSKEWKDGKPVPSPQGSEGDQYGGISQLVKVIRLESYEDTLNNLRIAEELPLRAVAATDADLKQEYFLHYLLALETVGSPSLLDVAQFADPTGYHLQIKKPGSEAQAPRGVDLVETFNWLLGLRVSRLLAPQTFSAEFEEEQDSELGADAGKRWVLKPDSLQPHHSPSPQPSPKGRGSKSSGEGIWWLRTVQGVLADGKLVWVVWRKLTADPVRDNLVLEAYLREQLGFDVRQPDNPPCAVLYVNGSHALPNLPQCEVRQLEEAFHRLMWDAQDGQ